MKKEGIKGIRAVVNSSGEDFCRKYIRTLFRDVKQSQEKKTPCVGKTSLCLICHSTLMNSSRQAVEN